METHLGTHPEWSYLCGAQLWHSSPHSLWVWRWTPHFGRHIFEAFTCLLSVFYKFSTNGSIPFWIIFFFYFRHWWSVFFRHSFQSFLSMKVSNYLHVSWDVCQVCFYLLFYDLLLCPLVIIILPNVDITSVSYSFLIILILT